MRESCFGGGDEREGKSDGGERWKFVRSVSVTGSRTLGEGRHVEDWRGALEMGRDGWEREQGKATRRKRRRQSEREE